MVTYFMLYFAYLVCGPRQTLVLLFPVEH